MWGVLGRLCIVGGIRIGVTNNDTDNLPTFEDDAANRWRGTAELPGGGWWKLVEVQRGR
jgi:hypothetical protein